MGTAIMRTSTPAGGHRRPEHTSWLERIDDWLGAAILILRRYIPKSKTKTKLWALELERELWQASGQSHGHMVAQTTGQLAMIFYQPWLLAFLYYLWRHLPQLRLFLVLSILAATGWNALILIGGGTISRAAWRGLRRRMTATNSLST